jgi:regulator of sigma E protease
LLAALLVLSIIVLFPEFGHFLFAKLNGVTVVEFSVGFGPRLLSWVSKKSGTRYSLKILPLGGSCAMLGEDGEEDENQAPAGQAEGSFLSKSPLARIVIIAAGPAFNFLMAFAFALFIVFYVGYDSPELVGVTDGFPAERAGMQAGDVVTGIGNRRVSIARDITLYLMAHPAEPVKVTYERLDTAAGTWETHEAVLTPEYSEESGSYLLGVKFNGYRTAVKNPLEAVKYAACEVRYVIRSVIDSLRMMVSGSISSDDIAGPVRIVTIIDDTVEEAKEYGFLTVLLNVLNLSVLFSANLGVMNLLPLPALDGGRLVFLFLELLRGKPVDQRFEGAVHLTGMALLMAFMVFVIFNDFRNI